MMKVLNRIDLKYADNIVLARDFNKNDFIIDINNLDLVNLIKYSSNNLGWGENIEDFLMFLYLGHKCYFENELEEKMELSELEDYLKIDEDAAIFIPIGVSDMEGGIQLANGKIGEYGVFDLGSIKLYEDTVVGLIVDIINNEYRFKIAEFNACTGSYDITKNCGDVTIEVIQLIQKFTIEKGTHKI